MQAIFRSTLQILNYYYIGAIWQLQYYVHTYIHISHMEILIILLNLIFQIWLLSIFLGHFIEEFGCVIAFPVQVWS